MKRPRLPSNVDHLQLAGFAQHTAWVIALDDGAGMPADICDDVRLDKALLRAKIEPPHLASTPVWEPDGVRVGAGVVER